MASTTEIMRRLSALNLTADAFKEVLAIIADATEPDPSKEYRRDVPNSVWNELRLQVRERDGLICRYCRTGVGEDFCCDHVIPKSKGGASCLENLAVACKSCNGSKRDLTLEEWRARL